MLSHKKVKLPLWQLIFSCLIIAIIPNKANAAPWDTVDYYLCFNQTGWGGGFGSFAIACDVEPWGQSNFVIDKFTPVIFDHNNLSGERNRYMNELHAMLRDSIDYYITSRKPDVSPAEKEAWRLANFAKAHQETYWTHYRKSQQNDIQMIRGDSGHGHGLVQIDDRWHFTKIEEGAGWHIFKNITYGMEIFYSEWQRAETATCVDSASDWLHRSQAAYSAYNGGPTKLCRWQDPNDVWAQNDAGYLEKITQKTWLDNISNIDYLTQLDISCFMEEARGCSAAEGMVEVDSEDPTNWPGRSINLESGEICVLNNDLFECVADASDLVCLDLQYGVTNGQVFPSIAATQSYTKNIQDKQQCYQSAIPDLVFPGQALKVIAKNTSDNSPIDFALFTDVGGSNTGSSTVWGKPYQVLDFIVTKPSSANTAQLYYQVKELYSQGYFLAGAIDKLNQVTQATEVNLLAKHYISIARVADEIVIYNEQGIKLYTEINNPQTLLITVPVNALVIVKAVTIQGKDNDIYYQVDYASMTGYLYGGKMLNGNTQANWANIKAPLTGDSLTTKIAIAFKPAGTADGDNSQNTIIPMNSTFAVKEAILKFKGETYELWDYSVTYNGKTGVVFGGFTQTEKAADVFNDSNALHPSLVGASRYYENRMTFTAGETDIDHDGMPNTWELQYGFDPSNADDAAFDADNDGLTNADEYLFKTEPLNPDTDNDGVLDGQDTQLDPVGEITLNASSYSVNENQGSLILTLTRNNGSFGELSVDIAFIDSSAKNNTDFKATNSSVIFADKQLEQTVTIEIVDDSDYVGNIEFSVKLTVSAGSTATLGANNTATITIMENETAPVVAPPVVKPKEESSGGGAINVFLAMLLLMVQVRRKTS